MPPRRLWFDVEVRYNTTRNYTKVSGNLLWFDVEVRYNTTPLSNWRKRYRCGLM